MSTYTATPVSPRQESSHPSAYIPQYPQPPVSPSSEQRAPQAYMNVDPQLNNGPGQLQAHAQSQSNTQSQTPAKGKKGERTGEIKNRLRKACDSCSIRKVKCDEAGPPCKACVGLQIPCTFKRQPKRRGPPNRHAEQVKRGRLDAAAMSQPTSPTQTAQTLAAFAQQAVLSAETICSLPLIYSLVQDYFTYIHPVIPLPHKPSFMNALNQREDMNNGTFLALLASMLGCLVASFPRRPRQHFRHHGLQLQFPNSMSFISRCQHVTLQAQGTGYLGRQLTIHDAIISYLQGLTAAYTYDRQSTLIYFNLCLMIMTNIGVHKAGNIKNRHPGAPQARMVPNGHVLEGPQPGEEIDCIDQELRKRTFWIMFVSVRSILQVGVSDWELSIHRATKSQPYPPLPLEIDDEYLLPNQVYAQPPGLVSELTGFNANVRIYSTYDELVNIEYNHGMDELVNWEQQKRILEKALQDVKEVCERLPTQLSLNLQPAQRQDNGQRYPSPAPGISGPEGLSHYANNSSDLRQSDYVQVHEERRIQHEIQKANIHGSQLQTRSYLVEKYWTFNDARKRGESGTNDTALDAIAPALDRQDLSSTQIGMSEQDFTNERDNIIENTLHFLSSIDQVNMEPNSVSFIGKIRQIASTLRDKPRTSKGNLASKADEYFDTFLGFLTKLEGGESRRDGPEEDEEAQLRHWANLKEYQARFHQSGGFSLY